MPRKKLKGSGGRFRCKVEGCKFFALSPSVVRGHYFKAHPEMVDHWKWGRHPSRAERKAQAASGLPTTKGAVGRPRGTAITHAPMAFCPNCGEKLRGWRRLQ